MRTNLRPQFDGGANYYKLLELARMIESENFHEDVKTEAKPTNQKGKAKVEAVTIDNTAQQIQQLQGAVKGLNKLIQGSRQIIQPQQIPQFIPQLCKTILILCHWLLRTKTLLTLKVVEVAEVGLEAEVVEVEVEEVSSCAIGAGTSCLKNKPITKWLIVLIKIRPRMPGGKDN